MSLFEALLSYHLRMSYEGNRDPLSKSRTADENAATLQNLMKELKVNQIESKELQALIGKEILSGKVESISRLR